MKFWDYIGEFLLFRWLFGSHKRHETRQNVQDSIIDPDNSHFMDDIYHSDGMDSHVDYGRRYHSYDSWRDDQDYGYSQSYDDFHDDFHDGHDDYDMMDDDY